MWRSLFITKLNNKWHIMPKIERIIMCFETGFSVLLDIRMWERWAPFLISIVAVSIAYWQVQVGRKATLSAQANSIYQQYLSMCMANPEFASGTYVAVDVNDNKYAEYTWFFSSMLFAFEQVLEANPKDDQWSGTIESQLVAHKEHIKKSKTANSDDWYEGLKKILDKVNRSE
jgi:hypothetical protein